MAATGTASLTVAELGEFARFSGAEQRFIEHSLDLARGHVPLRTLARLPGEACGLRERALAYRELRALRSVIPDPDSLAGVDRFMGLLLRVTAQDLARGGLDSFAAYRFLYERLLGAAVRPWLPAAFCGAAALPQIAPARRKKLLQTLSEAAATAPAWSATEPTFYPRSLDLETG